MNLFKLDYSLFGNTLMIISLTCCANVLLAQADGAAQDGDKNIKEGIFINPEISPEFPGGMDSLYSFMISKLSIQPEPVSGCNPGRVFARFVITETGKVTDPVIMRGICPYFDDMVLQMLYEMPDWKPATMSGKPISSNYTIPVNFKYD